MEEDIREIIESVCPSVFLTNRKRETLINLLVGYINGNNNEKENEVIDDSFKNLKSPLTII